MLSILSALIVAPPLPACKNFPDNPLKNRINNNNLLSKTPENNYSTFCNSLVRKFYEGSKICIPLKNINLGILN
jgi:hypothetical protein